jgi:hypothetical protein
MLAAFGRAFLFAVACWVVCLIVAEVVLGYNLYFQPNVVVLAACHVPAVLGGLMYLGFTARRWCRRPMPPEADAKPSAAADPAHDSASGSA